MFAGGFNSNIEVAMMACSSWLTMSRRKLSGQILIKSSTRVSLEVTMGTGTCAIYRSFLVIQFARSYLPHKPDMHFSICASDDPQLVLSAVAQKYQDAPIHMMQ
jgi:hypothetical protein